MATCKNILDSNVCVFCLRCSSFGMLIVNVLYLTLQFGFLCMKRWKVWNGVMNLNL